MRQIKGPMLERQLKLPLLLKYELPKAAALTARSAPAFLPAFALVFPTRLAAFAFCLAGLQSHAYRWHHGAPSASTRAALVLASVGCDWRGPYL